MIDLNKHFQRKTNNKKVIRHFDDLMPSLSNVDEIPARSGGGYFGFQVIGMIEGYVWALKFSIPGLFCMA